MSTSLARRIFLFATAVCCFVSFLAWLVNTDVTATYFFGMELGVSALMPQAVYRWFATLAVDFSTSSPLMFFLTFGFPLAYLFLRRCGRIPASLQDVYPPGWTYFLVSIGLGGTLFGMTVALYAVANSTSRDGAVLMDVVAGSATALISTLVALVCEFLSAMLRSGMRAFALMPALPDATPDEISALARSVQDLRQQFAALNDEAATFRKWLEAQPERFAELLDSQQKQLAVQQETRDAQQRTCDASEAILALLSDEHAQAEASRRTDRLIAAVRAGNSAVSRHCATLTLTNGRPKR